MSTRAWAGFFAMSTIWGVPYLFIKVAVDDGVPPAFLAWCRVVLAAVVLLALAGRAGTLGSLRGRGRWLLAFAVFEIAVPFPLIAFGEGHVDSSVAAIIIAAAPLIVAVLALRFDASERVSGRRLVGLLIGLAGVVALVGIDIAGRTGELLGAGGDRHRGRAGGAAGRGGDPGRRRRLRRGADGPESQARRRRSGGDEGREPRDRRRAADAVRGRASARRDAAARGGRRPARPRSRVHGGRVRHLLGPDRRDRAGARAGDHLRRAGRGGRAPRPRPPPGAPAGGGGPAAGP